jgi:hypothetical protein
MPGHSKGVADKGVQGSRVARTESGRSASRLRLIGSGKFQDPRGAHGHL